MIVEPVAVKDTRVLRQAVLRPHQTLEALASHEPPGAHAVGAFDQGELVAVGLIAPGGEPGEWRIRGMAALERVRGRGAGTAILDALLAHAREQGASAVWANVRVPACSLYQRAGMRVISDQFELPQIGPHVVMRVDFESEEDR